jgi:hypothetical protein
MLNVVVYISSTFLIISNLLIDMSISHIIFVANKNVFVRMNCVGDSGILLVSSLRRTTTTGTR